MQFLTRRQSTTAINGNPFTSSIQTRFRKPANTAQTRIQSRIPDTKLDLNAHYHHRLTLILHLHDALSKKRRPRPFISLNLLSKWAPHLGLKTLTAMEFVKKYPHVFDVFTHPVKRNVCCRFTDAFVGLLEEDDRVVRETMEEDNAMKLRKILSMSLDGKVHLQGIRLMRRDIGLPEDFLDSIVKKHSGIFQLAEDSEAIELVGWNDVKRSDFSAEVEKWREREFTEKWLSEYETKYAFPMNFPTGFKKVPGFRQRLSNWQRVSYVKPYERVEKARICRHTCGGLERYEKRAVGIVHELLCTTVEKMVEVDKLAHFRKNLGIEVNLRELLLKHPGIFYVSVKGDRILVLLREAYDKKGCLVERSSVYDVRRKMLELMLLGCRNTNRRDVANVYNHHLSNAT